MRYTFLFVVAIAATLLTSCNTMIGVGRDMKMGGEGLEKSATKVSGGHPDGAVSDDNSGAPVY